jgi:flagellar biosynthesis protein FliR
MDPLVLQDKDIYRTLLVMFRVGAFFMGVPVFNHIAIPRMLRLWFIIMIAFLVVPSSVVDDVSLPTSSLQLACIILSECAIGFLMSFAVVTLFSAIQFAGHIIGVQMGLSVSEVFDPMSQGGMSTIGEFYYLVSILIYFLINGHHILVKTLVHSFEVVPLGGGIFHMDIQNFIIHLTVMVFVVAIKLAAPVIITLFIVNCVLGIIARTVPQMNVFIVGFPLTLGIGFIFIGISFPYFYGVLTKAFTGMEKNMVSIVNMIAR